MAGARIQLKRATASSWSSNNPVLYAGEIGFETDTNKFKIGDGTTAYNSLVYFNGNLTGSSLNDLADVTIVSAANGDFLRWNGTAWINDAVNLSTDTVGSYVESLVAGTGVTLTNNSGEAATPTVAIGQSVATSASVTFAHVSAPVTGNVTGDASGNAGTATALQNARTIALAGNLSGSASFNGTADATITASLNATINDLTDTVVSTPLVNQSLVYDGTNWVNMYAPTATYARNAEATTLQVGEVVYLFGAAGDRASVKRASNNSDATSSKTVGVVETAGAAGADVAIVTNGYVNGLNLGGYNAGDVLWLGSAPGTLTSTKPSAPQHMVFIGVVARANNGNGILYVRAQNGYELEELHDVKVVSPADGQYLRYSSSSAVWINDTINLGTDTSGDYVQNLVAGTGVTLSNNSGEGSTPTVAIGQDVGTSASVTFARLTVQGDMQVQGTITRLNETNLNVDEAFIYLNAASASANPDMGVAFNYNDGSYKHAGLFRDASDGLFKIFDGYTPEPQTPIDTSHGSYNNASFQAKTISLTQTTGTAPLSVSSSTVVTNLNADKLDGQDGSYYAPIDSPTFTGTVTLPNNTVALGSQTTGNYMVDVSGGTGISVTHTQSEGSTATVSLNAYLDDLVNVSVPTPTNGYVLTYSSASSAWIAQEGATAINALDDIGNVTAPSPSSGDFLKWNGSAWINDPINLGTDTTGNYMVNVSAGDGITVSHTQAEGSTATVSARDTLVRFYMEVM